MTAVAVVYASMNRHSPKILLPHVFALMLMASANAAASDIRDDMPSIARIETTETAATIEDETSFGLRVYKDDEPVRRRHSKENDFFAVDITNYLDICSDGQAHIRAISIGSWQFDLDGDCAGDTLNSNVTVIWEEMLQSQ